MIFVTFWDVQLKNGSRYLLGTNFTHRVIMKVSSIKLFQVMEVHTLCPMTDCVNYRKCVPYDLCNFLGCTTEKWLSLLTGNELHASSHYECFKIKLFQVMEVQLNATFHSECKCSV